MHRDVYPDRKVLFVVKLVGGMHFAVSKSIIWTISFLLFKKNTKIKYFNSFFADKIINNSSKQTASCVQSV